MEPALNASLKAGNNLPEVPEAAPSNYVWTVCMEKHLQYNRVHPGVAYKDNSNKKVKSNGRCFLYKKYLYVKPGSTFWEDYHSKVQYWR